MKPTLHLLGLPHTITNSTYSSCAFTGKVLRFSPMMRSVGYRVVHYGNAGATSGANEQVDILSQEELANFIGEYAPAGQAFVGDTANVGNPLFLEFNARLRPLLHRAAKPGDVICLPFGYAHQQAIDGLARPILETGIGYPETFAPYKVFESQAWYHWHCGRDNRHGHDYNWVIPNYFDISEWTLRPDKGAYLLFFGRICEVKGLRTVLEIAKHRPDLRVVLCGQGDPAPYLGLPNVEYHPPVQGTDRDALLGNALAVLMPTRYVEPFGGVTVEANLTGTPVLGASYGSFTETIQPRVNGFRCRTLGEWLAAIEQVEGWGAPERTRISRLARAKYDMYVIAHEYDDVIQQIADLSGEGWYSLRNNIGPVRKATVPNAVAA